VCVSAGIGMCERNRPIYWERFVLCGILCGGIGGSKFHLFAGRGQVVGIGDH
jgi:hypothetical protein